MIDRETEVFAAIPVIQSALRMLEEMPSYLHFHCPEHTLSVFWVVTALALIDDLPKNVRELTAIAAAYHDLGFLTVASGALERPFENEERGAEIAVSAMTGLYEDSDIQIVREMILETAIVPTEGEEAGETEQQVAIQSPHLLDADLHNLGTDDYLPSVLNLYNERSSEKVPSLAVLKQSAEGLEFLKESLKFIERHRWKTRSAQALFGEKKDENARTLKALLGA